MKKYYHILILFFYVSSVIAQNNLSFMTGVKDDSVYIFMRETPKNGQGFVIKRKDPGTGVFQKLTEKPLRAMWNPAEAESELGQNYKVIADMLHSNSTVETLLKLRSDDFFGGVISLLNHKVGKILGRFYAAGDNKKGEAYIYRVIKVDRNGREIEHSDKKVLIKEKPVQLVTKITCEPVQKGVNINWEYPEWSGSSNDMTIRFNLYRRQGDSDFEKVRKTFLRTNEKSFSYIDEGVKKGKEYTYMIKAVDATGLESKPSGLVKTVFLDLTAPSAPLGITAEPGNLSVNLAWTPNTEFDLASYNVYRSRGLKQNPVRINSDPVSAENSFYKDSTGTGGVQFFYSITAVDSSGNESSQSVRIGTVPIDNVPPGCPSDLVFEVERKTVKLQWKAPDDKDLKGFWISRGLSKESTVHLFSDIFNSTCIYDSSDGIFPGKHYVYIVESVDSVENKSKPVYISVKIPDDEPPFPVEAIYIENNKGNNLLVNWNCSTSLDAENYILYRYPDFACDSIVQSVSHTRKYIDSTAVKGVSYKYSIVVSDSSGNRSKPVSSDPFVLRDFISPAAPSDVSAQLTEQGVKISWSQVKDLDVLGYNIYKSNLPTGVYKKLNNEPVSKNQFLHKEGTLGLWYRIRSVDTSGNESKAGRPVSCKSGM